MKKLSIVVALAAAGLLMMAAANSWQGQTSFQKAHFAGLPGTGNQHAPASTVKGTLAAFGRLPLSFEENTGRTDPRVKFLAHGPGYAMYLGQSEAVLVRHIAVPANQMNVADSPVADMIGVSHRKSVFRLDWLGANAHARMHEEGRQSGTSNYFIGNQPDKWRRKVAHYGSVRYDDLYPGINLVYHGNQQNVEFDYELAPGSDPSAIRIGIAGPSVVELASDGILKISAAGDQIALRPPVAYQEEKGQRKPVEARYVMEGTHRVGFQLGAYDQSRKLVIDPVLDYAAAFGTQSSFTYLTEIAVDTQGNTYVTGASCDTDYPITVGAFQSTGGSTTAEGCFTAVVSKLNPSASSLVYSTYVGGTTDDSTGGRLKIDAAGEAYVGGITAATDFPTTANAFQKQAKGGTCDYGPFIKGKPCSDGILFKLSADGSSLVFSTLLGGERIDMITALALDANNNIYVTGATNSTAFPIVGSAIQSTYGGGTCTEDVAACFDAFVAELNPDASSLLASTYLGGNDNDYGVGIAFDPSGNVYLAGNSTSTNFPTTAGSFQPNHAGTVGSPQPDAFVAKMNPALSALSYSTFIGGSAYDLAFALKVDSTGAAYITGSTASADFPTTAGAFQTVYGGPTAPPPDCPDAIDSFVLNEPSCGDVFVTKLNPAGSALAFSTYLGGSGNDIAFNLALDSALNVWVIGNTNSPNFAYSGDAYYQTSSSTPELFLAEVSADGAHVPFATPLVSGHRDSSLGLGITIDSTDNVYLAGQASTFNPTPGTFTSAAGIGVFVMKFSPGTSRPGVQLSATSLNFPPTNLNGVSDPQTVTLTNNGTATLHLAISLNNNSFSANPVTEFTESNDCGTTVAAGAQCTITVTFLPTPNGQGAVIAIQSDAPNAPHSIFLLGSAVSPATASFLPTTVTFGAQQPGVTSASQFLSLSGTGTNFAKPTALPVLSGANAADFQMDTTNCPPNANFCSLGITYAPLNSGAIPRASTATVTLATNAPNSPQTATLTGTTTNDPVLIFISNPFTFTPVATGVNQNASVALKNTGGSNLLITAITSNNPEFTFSAAGCPLPPITLTPQQACNLGVSFAPAQAGLRTATLAVTDNETTATNLVLNGMGTTPGGPALQLLTTGNTSGSTLIFADAVVGQPQTSNNSSLAIVSLLNTGSGAGSGAHITNFTLSSDYTQTNDCPVPPAQLAGGLNCSYTLHFAPTATGARPGSLTIMTDAPGNPSFTVNLLGSGVLTPQVAMNPVILNFNRASAGSTSDGLVTILTNTGNGPLQFSNVSISGPFTQTNNCTSPLAAGASCQFAVKFMPTTAGPAGGLLTFTSNAAGGKFAVGLNGTGATGPAPAVVPASLTFGNQAIGTTSTPQLVTFSNAGDAAFTFAGLKASENFTASSNCPASLAPGANCTVQVFFAPTADTFPGPFPANGIVGLTTNAPGSPTTIGLTGFAGNSTVAATTAMLASSLNPATVGQTVALIATVSSTTQNLLLNGSVNFLDGGTLIATVAMTNGQATLSTSRFTAGSHSIVATYTGNGNFGASSSPAVIQQVNGSGATATTTALTSAPNPSTAGQSVTFTATVTGAGGTPSGTVTFMDGINPIGAVPLSSGVAAFPTTTLAAGTHSITASYGGDANFAASTSIAVSQVVNGAGKTSTTTALAAAPNPSTPGQSVTFTATVSGAGGTPTGTVAFLDGATQIGTMPLNGSGVAAFPTTTLTAGTHSITASYGGDANFAASTSTAVSQVVNGTGSAGTTTVLVSAPDPSTSGSSVTFTATVTSALAQTPTGTVAFFDGTTQIGTGALNGSAVAAFASSALTVGAHSMTAHYQGDATFAGSISTAVTQTVTAAADFSLSSNPITASVVAGTTASYTISVTPINGFSQPVALTCAGAPAAGTCSLFPTTVVPSGGTAANATMNVTTTARSLLPGVRRFLPPGGRRIMILPVWLLLVLAVVSVALLLAASNRLAKAGLSLALLIFLASMGCGGGNTTTGGGKGGTPAGSSTLTITGTSGTGSTAISHSVSVSLSVQ